MEVHDQPATVSFLQHGGPPPFALDVAALLRVHRTIVAERRPRDVTDEMQYLRWRVSSLDDEEPYTDFQDAKVTVKHDGEDFGPFDVRAVRRTPGQYQTQHIFTAAGEYESVLSFRKGEEPEVHTVDFAFRIRDRQSLEIPGRKGGGR